MISGESIVGQRERVLMQQVEGDSVLLDIDSGEYFTLNPVGSLVWERCDGATSVSTIVSVVCDEFDADPGTVLTDVLALVDALAGAGLVVAR